MELDYEEAKHLLYRAVAEKGEEHVYSNPHPAPDTCLYFWSDGKPSCIIGYVLAYKGICFANSWNNIVPVWELPERTQRITFDGKALKLLTLAQLLQDGGVPWGKTAQLSTETVDDWGVEFDPVDIANAYIG